MSEVMQGILAEAKKSRFSTINPSISEDDVASVWDNVSAFIEKQMSQQKGVIINGLGTFTFTQKKLDIGNNKFILIQRPVFQVSEKFGQSQSLQYTKYHVPGQIPAIPLNFAALAFESPFDRDTVESCVKEILGAITRAVGGKRNIELTFAGIGRLSIRECKVKMKFYKEFVTQMDGSGKLIKTMINRPGTVDSVMSDRPSSRPITSNTLLLPRLNPLPIGVGIQNLTPLPEMKEEDDAAAIAASNALMEAALAREEAQTGYCEDPLNEALIADFQERMVPPDTEDVTTTQAITNMLDEGVPLDNRYHIYQPQDEDLPSPYPTGLVDTCPDQLLAPDQQLSSEDVHKVSPVSRSGSRTAIPLAQATGISLTEDFNVNHCPIPKSRSARITRSCTSPLSQMDGLGARLPKPMTPPRLEAIEHSKTELGPGEAPEKCVQFSHISPPPSSCGHANAGQELCYLCHQRARRNIPVSFNEESKQLEEEDDRLLQQYQSMKDAEDTLKEQDKMLARRHDLQKLASFNLGVSETVRSKKHSRDTDFHRSYVFQKRPLTPPRFFKQDTYCKDLSKQVDAKDTVKKKRKNDEEFLERLEQVQLAEDLAAQREQYLQDKYGQQEMYRKALDAQIFLRGDLRRSDGLLMSPKPYAAGCYSPLTIPRPKILMPFSDTYVARVTEKMGSPKSPPNKLKFKPLQVPGRESDSEVFGTNDMNNDKMAERRRRANDLFREQQDLVAQRKREAILKRLAEQKEEEAVLERTKRELLEDRANRFTRRFENRKTLEGDWCEAAECKRSRDLDERLRGISPGILLHDTVDKHKRCRQCKRKLNNCGESNIWSESRYIPGSRLMV